jgi:hypothetical protein
MKVLSVSEGNDILFPFGLGLVDGKNMTKQSRCQSLDQRFPNRGFLR